MNELGDDTLPAGHGRVAAAVRRRGPAILRAWEADVRLTLAGAAALSPAGRVDAVPAVLDHLSAALADPRPESVAALAKRAGEHGTMRFAQRYTLPHLLAEYRLLRRAAFDAVEADLAGGFAPGDVAALNAAVDAVAEGAVAAYADAQRHHLARAAEVESQFLSYLAHDQQNHLHHALLLLEVHTVEVAEHPALAESLADLREVRRAIVDTAEGMQRLMQAERLRRVAVESRRRPVDLAEVLAATADAFAGQAAAKGLAVDWSTADGATVNAEPTLIRLAVNNLVNNAIKFSTAGTVRLAAGRADGGGWRVTVADQGPGITPDHIGQLFEAFARGETHGQAGMGLGLSIASRAARLLGGRLTVESAVGVGSTFTLAIPDGPADPLPPDAAG